MLIELLDRVLLDFELCNQIGPLRSNGINVSVAENESRNNVADANIAPCGIVEVGIYAIEQSNFCRERNVRRNVQ